MVTYNIGGGSIVSQTLGLSQQGVCSSKNVSVASVEKVDSIDVITDGEVSVEMIFFVGLEEEIVVFGVMVVDFEVLVGIDVDFAVVSIVFAIGFVFGDSCVVAIVVCIELVSITTFVVVASLIIAVLVLVVSEIEGSISFSASFSVAIVVFGDVSQIGRVEGAFSDVTLSTKLGQNPLYVSLNPENIKVTVWYVIAWH